MAVPGLNQKKELATVVISHLINAQVYGEEPQYFLRTFLDTCIMDLIKEKPVERYFEFLVDKTVARGGFTKKEIQYMRDWKLGDLSIVDITEKPAAFKIQNKDGLFIEFSNRGSENYEPRGEKLKQGLKETCEKDKGISLYDALTKQLRESGFLVASVWRGFFNGPRDYFADDAEARRLIEQNEAVVENALIKLSTACMQYIMKGREKGIADDVLIQQLKNLMLVNGKDILLAALDEKISQYALKAKIDVAIDRLKETEKTAKAWIMDTSSLADAEYPHHYEIRTFADAAEKILQSTGQPAGQMDEKIAALQNSWRAIKYLQIGNISWKNWRNFLLIPSIMLLMKTKGGSFWYRTETVGSKALATMPEIFKPLLDISDVPAIPESPPPQLPQLLPKSSSLSPGFREELFKISKGIPLEQPKEEEKPVESGPKLSGLGSDYEGFTTKDIEQLAKKTALLAKQRVFLRTVLREPHIDTFLKSCVLEPVEARTEKMSSKGKFTADEIKRMQSWQLKDLKFMHKKSDEDFPEFKIRHKDEDKKYGIKFSNINKDDELSGDLLKNGLRELGFGKPQSTMSLYDALIYLSREKAVESFVSDKKVSGYDDAIKCLTKLSVTFMKYVAEERKLGISSDELIIQRLKNLMATKGEEILLAALDEKTSPGFLLQFLKIKEAEIAADWIETVRKLSYKYSDLSEPRVRIMRVVDAAVALLNHHHEYLAPGDLAAEEKRSLERKGEGLLSNFKKAVDDVQDLHIEQLNWNNVPKFLIYLMECIVNYFKTDRKSFWLPKLPEIPAMLRANREPKLKS